MRTKLIAIFLVMFGCGRKVKLDEQVSTVFKNYNRALNVHDDYFQPWIEDAEALLGETSRTLVRFAEEDEGMLELAAGVCLLPSRVVVINPDQWGRYSDERRLVLMLHELGHCDHGLEHTVEKPKLTGVLDRCGTGAGIMHPHIDCAHEFFINNNGIGEMLNEKEI